MNINSDRAEVKEKTFFLSKIPVYLMYLLILIPHRSDKKWKYAVGNSPLCHCQVLPGCTANSCLYNTGSNIWFTNLYLFVYL